MLLQDVILANGYSYESTFTNRAHDIDFESKERLAFCLGYILKHAKRIDAEIPDRMIHWINEIIPNYPIKNGYVDLGIEMKWGREYRIYFDTTYQMPRELLSNLQNDKFMRLTSSRFIETLFYIGFIPGSKQDENLVRAVVEEMFLDSSCRSAFEDGYNA